MPVCSLTKSPMIWLWKALEVSSLVSWQTSSILVRITRGYKSRSSLGSVKQKTFLKHMDRLKICVCEGLKGFAKFNFIFTVIDKYLSNDVTISIGDFARKS